MVRVVYEYMERGKGRSIERVERGVGLNVAGTKCVEWTGWVDVQIDPSEYSPTSLVGCSRTSLLCVDGKDENQ